MHYFVTGASGWIGSAVLPELIDHGHRVVGLARSDGSADTITALGGEVVRGTLDDLDVLADAAGASDGVIHLAFKHDIAFSGDFEAAAVADRAAVDAVADALAGTDKPFVLASGLLGLAPGRVATEEDGHDQGDGSATHPGPSMRMATAEHVRMLAARGIRTSVLRLPPTVHGDGDEGFMTMIVNMCRTAGTAGYTGDGSHRWPAVHRSDAARLFRLAAERAPAGSTLHAVGDEGVSGRAIAEVIGRHLDLPVQALSPEEADATFNFLAMLLAIDSPASAAITRRLLGWEPTGSGLIEDLEQGHYFRDPA